MYGGGGGQWPGQQQPMGGYMQPQQTGFNPQQQQQQRPMGMQPQQTGYMGQQPTGMSMGMGMMPQQTGMGIGMGYPSAGAGLGGMRQSSGFIPQQQQMQQQPQRFLSAPNSMMMQPQQTGMMQPQQTGMGMGMMQPQQTGMGMMQPQATGMMRPGGLTPQMTGYSGGPMGMQSTGLMPQMTGMPMDPRMQLMSMQFLPAAQPYQGGIPMAGNMNFNNASMQPSNFQNQIQNLSQQQQGSKEPKIPWALSKDERKSYDSIFRAWDQKGTGFLSGDVAQEVFGQSGLDRDKLMQVWHLADTENRGKLNLAEFHVAMGLIYRALNGNDVPEHLPPELVPPSARDLSESVDFLKDLLKRDANVRQSTALNLPEAGSNKDVAYGKTRSFHENPIQKQDAAAYKHTDESSSGYKSSARHLDRRTVRYGGESAADDLSEMKRQLAQTQRMLDSQEEKDEDDREVEREMEELRFRIKRVQDDIDYYNRRGGRDAAENRRKAERELMHLMHERLPLIEKRLEEKEKKNRDKNLNESRDRDRRNESSYRGARYGDDEYSSRRGRASDYDRDSNYNSRSQTPTQREQDRTRRSDSVTDDARSPPPPPPESAQDVSRPAPAPPAPAPVAAVAAPAPPAAGPPKTMTAEERQAWIRSEAQRRIAERMRALGAVAPGAEGSTPDASVEQRLAADKAEAEARASQADADAAAREEARRARLEEQRLEREKAAVSTIKSELNEQEKGGAPAPVVQAAREEVDEQEEMLRRREEVLQKEKEERLARFKKLEEEEEDARRQEAAFKERQAQFGVKSGSTALPAPVRKGKGGPPPPPPTRSRAPAAPSVPAAASGPAMPAPQEGASAPPAPVEPVVSPPAQSAGGSSTNPFHRMQPNGAAATPGGTNPFFRQQQGQQDGAIKSPPPNFASTLPAPQRSAAQGQAPAATAPPAPAAPRRAPDEDDDWGESEHGDHDDDPDGPGSTSRATRQNLAAALFSNLVSTPPQSSTPAPLAAPPAPVAPAAPAPPPAPAAPEQADASQPPPPPPPAPASVAPIPMAPSSGPPDRSALLGDIRGGLRLRKAETHDRSSAPVSGKVLGDASAPVQTYVPPPSPPAVEPEVVENGASHEEAPMGNPNRQSVDWANSLAAEQMNQGSKASAMPDEPSVQEEAEDSDDAVPVPEDVDGPTHSHLANGSASGSHGADATETDDFDLTQTVRVRTLYAYDAQRDEDLSMPENAVVLAHPAKDASNDWWYGSLASSPNKMGTFPRAYVASIDSTTLAMALYDFEGSSPDEMSFKTDDELHVVDHEDASWYKVLSPDHRILIVPATYVELLPASGVAEAVMPVVAATGDGKSGPSTSVNTDENSGSAALASSEEEALRLAMRASQKDHREESLARSREDKDLRRALALSAAEQDAPTTPAHLPLSTQQETSILGSHGIDDDDDASSSGYSTTGWTSSDEDDDEGEDLANASDEEIDPEAQKQRAAERLRVLEAAGILIVDDQNTTTSSGKQAADESAEMRGVEEAFQLTRRATRKKAKPERPERSSKGRERRSKPDRPERRPPPPPKEKKPEEEMEDAYDRFVKLSKQIETSRAKHATSASDMSATSTAHGHTSIESAVKTPTSPLSPLHTGNSSIGQAANSQSLGTSVISAGSGFFSSIRSRIGSSTPGERKTTPTISGPMALGVGSTPPPGAHGKELLASATIASTTSDTSTAVSSHMTSTTWTSLIGADSVRDMPDVERKRQEAIFELIATESTHVRDLQIVVNVFFNAIQPLLSTKAATVIFANIEEILLAAVSLLSDLEDRQRQERLFITRIGDILNTHMTNMSVYIPYCVNQETATQILTAERSRIPELQAVLGKIRNEDAAARGLDLSHFLLIPMQRLTRYPLLVQQIVRYTSENDNDDEIMDLQKAAAKAQRFLDTTNESIRQRQSDERLATLSERINNITGGTQVRLDLTHATRWMGPRRIVADEVVTKAKSGRKIALILCNDILLLMTGGRDADERLYRMPMPLEEIVVREVTSSLKGRDDAAFQIVHQGRERTNVRCASVRACHSLMHAIDTARSECLATANKRPVTKTRHARVVS